MTPGAFIEMAGREGVTISATAAGGIRLSGPEPAIRRLAFDAKALKTDILSHLSRRVPVDRDIKNPYETTPVPPVPPVPAKNGTGATVPDVPEEPTEPKTLCFQDIRHTVGNVATAKQTADNRRTCLDCTELVRGQCKAAARGELPHAARRYEPIADRLHRCLGYRPGPEDTDRRPGPERFPGMARKAALRSAA